LNQFSDILISRRESKGWKKVKWPGNLAYQASYMARMNSSGMPGSRDILQLLLDRFQKVSWCRILPDDQFLGQLSLTEFKFKDTAICEQMPVCSSDHCMVLLKPVMVIPALIVDNKLVIVSRWSVGMHALKIKNPGEPPPGKPTYMRKLTAQRTTRNSPRKSLLFYYSKEVHQLIDDGGQPFYFSLLFFRCHSGNT